MTEIRFDVDLDHPPERVWQALTDPRHLSRWFLPAEVDPDDSTRLRLRPDRVDGLGGPIDVEVVEAAAPSRLVKRWQGDDLHVRVVITIAPVADGSRLTFVQRGFLGRRGTPRRRVLRATYGRLFGEGLPRALDHIAGQGPTVALVAKAPPPPGNAGSASRATGRRNDGGFRGRRVRRYEVRPMVERRTEGEPGHPAEPQATAPRLPMPRSASTPPVAPRIPGQRAPGSHRAPGAAHRATGSAHRAGSEPRGATTSPGTHGVATGRASVPTASDWLAAQPAGRRHRAVVVPYQRGPGTRSIRRFVAVRPISEEPTRPLRLAERRGATLAVGAVVLLVMTVSLAAADRTTAHRRPAPARVGGAAEPPPRVRHRAGPARLCLAPRGRIRARTAPLGRMRARTAPRARRSTASRPSRRRTARRRPGPAGTAGR